MLTILGTRPEIIRLSCVMPLLDGLCEHRILHTGQNYEPTLDAVFWSELGLRTPDLRLAMADTSSSMAQVGRILEGADRALAQFVPDVVLILGDTNSALSAFAAKRRGIRVVHMEAGNRCYDESVPEEVNRRVVDHSSDLLLPYTERSRANLLREGIDSWRIFVVGNPIFEVLERYAERIAASQVLTQLGLEEGKYFLVTLHRAENVDSPGRLAGFLGGLDALASQYGHPIILSLHPRTRSQLDRQAAAVPDGVKAVDPLGLFDFVQLEKKAFCTLSDSGTVQEECAIFGVPNVTLRDSTERPETLDKGSNILATAHPDSILRAVRVAVELGGRWKPPAEYVTPYVSSTVARLVLGHWTDRRRTRAAETQGP